MTISDPSDYLPTPAEDISAKIRAKVALAESVKSFDPFAKLQAALKAEQDRREAEAEARKDHFEKCQMERQADFTWLMKRLGLLAPDAETLQKTSKIIGDARFALAYKGAVTNSADQDTRPVFAIDFPYTKLTDKKVFDLNVERTYTGEYGDHYRLTQDNGFYEDNDAIKSFWDSLLLDVAMYLLQCNAISMPSQGEV